VSQFFTPAKSKLVHPLTAALTQNAATCAGVTLLQSNNIAPKPGENPAASAAELQRCARSPYRHCAAQSKH